MSPSRKATLLVAAAYCWWGFSPVFWRELDSVAPLDQLSWRVALGLAYLAAVWIWRRSNPLGGLTRRHVTYGTFAALMIAANWGAFLWAVDNDQTNEAALGYFLMPLLAVALGVWLLGERLRPLQTVALVFGAIGMLWTLTVVGSVPWVACVLGVSFSLYGFAKKQGPWEVVDGLTFEMLVIAPVFILFLSVRGLGESHTIDGDGSLATIALIALTGLVTVVPLLLFAAAAKKVSLTVVGLLQYLNPVLQFLVGWQLFGEDVSPGRLFGFAWIWAALACVAADEVRSKRPVDGSEPSGGQRIVRSRKGPAAKEAPMR